MGRKYSNHKFCDFVEWDFLYSSFVYIEIYKHIEIIKGKIGISKTLIFLLFYVKYFVIRNIL